MHDKEPLLFDTTVWINFFRGVKNPQVDLLTQYIETEYTVLLCPIIIQEILQGIRDDQQFESIKELLLDFDILSIDPIESAIGAAHLYRSLRRKGITIRKSNDCLIAYYAIHFNVKLIHNDDDFELITKGEKRLKI